MKHTIYQVDAFASRTFEGNPAAVVPLEKWLPEETMQKIAMENNLSETAFFVSTQQGYHIRWYTPEAEVDLCGHATLASAHVLFEHLKNGTEIISFDSRSGQLDVRKESDFLVMNFPASKVEAHSIPSNLKTAFKIHPQKCYKGNNDLMLVFKTEEDILQLEPDFMQIMESKNRGVICTAKSEQYDFVSRFFAPAVGVNEDPVTGSAHTMLIPYWAGQLNKKELIAKQVSRRGGVLHCKHLKNRVEIGGKSVTYLIGEITI
jgi:PhzF family phenazine biosynthesis protein